MYSRREYVIFPVSEISKIDFNLVLENSAETLRRSVDGTKTFIKWNGSLGNSEPTEPYTPLFIPAGMPNMTGTYDPGTPSVVEPQPAEPNFLTTIVGIEGPYDHEEMLAILSTPEWTKIMEI